MMIPPYCKLSLTFLPRPTARSLLSLSAIWLVSLFLGCGRAASDDLVPVEGRVTVDDKPLTSGSISFRPDPSRGNKTLHHPTGTIDFRGNYKLYTANKRGAPPGWYKVLIFVYEPLENAKPKTGAMPPVTKSLIPEKYSDPRKSDVSVEVVAGAAPGAYDIKLRK